MSIAQSQKLRIPSHYYVYCDPPDKDGDEVLHFISPHRRIKLKGRFFREFVQHVVPRLDGSRSFQQVASEVGELFLEKDLAACLALLSENGLLEDAANWKLEERLQQRLRPQLNLFQDLSAQPWELQEKLVRSRVTVFGLNGAGAAAALSLAAAGIGSPTK